MSWPTNSHNLTLFKVLKYKIKCNIRVGCGILVIFNFEGTLMNISQFCTFFSNFKFHDFSSIFPLRINKENYCYKTWITYKHQISLSVYLAVYLIN